MSRQSGILLHVSSLSGPEGIGTLGKEAFEFADFLSRSGMQLWQVLPMGPTGFGESPYQSSSMYAGNPLLISLVTLREEGLVHFRDEDLSAAGSGPRVEFPSVREVHEQLLRKAYEESYAKISSEIQAFRARASWVDDFALYTALKKHFDQKAWNEWPRDIRMRRPDALQRYRNKLQTEIDYHVFCQFLFERQWNALQTHCHALGISLFGDMPIYVAQDSADTWTNPKVFQLDRNRAPRRVAGVPPDYFSEDGQLWGNPLYNWTYLRLTGYRWWLHRMSHMLNMYDIVRVDHFIGFANYYSIPYGSKNARNGKWVNAPGKSFFRKLKKYYPNARIVAEDLGVISDRVRSLIAYTGFPGMRVLVFGFGGESKDNIHHPSNWPENAIGYTGTHDNDTVLGYLLRAPETERKSAMDALQFDQIKDGPCAFVRCVLASPVDTAVLAMQDLLGLNNDARMNLPGTVGGNWGYRMCPGDLTENLSAELKQLNSENGRLSSHDES